MAFTDVITNTGVNAFGIGMPLLSPAWTTTGTLPAVQDDGMRLTLSGGAQWRAPLACIARRLADAAAPVGVTLTRPDGSSVTGPGLLLALYPQAHLRLARLYASVFQGNTEPSARPVPRYFFYGTPADAGHVAPGESLGVDGDLTVFDATGFPMDALAVASAFEVLMNAHHPLQQRAFDAGFEPNHQVKDIALLAGASGQVRLRLSDHSGQPHDGTHLTGLTAVAAARGIFSAGAGAALGKEPSDDAATGAFPEAVRRLIKLGLAPNGTLGDDLTLPAAVAGREPGRDFFSVRVVDLKPFLLGSPNTADDGVKVQRLPEIRLEENLTLLSDGNDVLGAAARALNGAAAESLVAAQDIESGFSPPQNTGAAAHWPGFPPVVVGVPPDAPASLAPDLRAGFNPVAQWAGSTPDVVLTVSGLPRGATVRVYNRRFVADAREARGDGVGGIVSDTGTLVVLLRDPLGLQALGFPPNLSMILRVDLAVVTRNRVSRIYGNVSAKIGSITNTAPPAAGPAPFDAAARRSTCRAGVLGFPGLAVAPGTSLLDAVLQSIGEGNPREGARLPTMARREILAAGLANASGGQWRSVLSAGRLGGELHSAETRLGSPGGSGGRETQTAGLATENGLLAYDLARAALRRTRNVVGRIDDLATDLWDQPTPGAGAGTFAAAVLQTVAPFCETPELAALQFAIDPDSTTRPRSWNELIQFVSTTLPTDLPLRQAIVAQLMTLQNNPEGQRLFDEVEGEIMSSIFGRRDALWALQGALSRARRFVYIESPGLASTMLPPAAGQPAPSHAVDLWQVLAGRMSAAPGLHVMFCSPKSPDFPPAYAPFVLVEAADRRAKIVALPTAADASPAASRVLAFHPVGFPGRPSRVESTVIVIDDVWAMVGGCTFRRRGLTFDGSTDVVLTDTTLLDGASPAIRDFRRALMARWLGVGPVPAPRMPDPTWVRLRDGVEAFHAIRSVLRAGGLGRIERLGGAFGPAVNPPPAHVVNPDGREFDLITTLALQFIAQAAGSSGGF
jgi:hypothetical protein